MSDTSIPEDAPDVTLRDLAFARLDEGRIVARGTALEVEYRRPGGRLRALHASGDIDPIRAPALAALGTLHATAPRVEGEFAARRGSASGGVQVRAERGDEAHGESLKWDGVAHTVSSDAPVSARGAGYDVRGSAMVADESGRWFRLLGGMRGRVDAKEMPR